MSSEPISLVLEVDTYGNPAFLERFISELECRTNQKIRTIRTSLADALPLVGYVLLVSRNHTKFSLDECSEADRSDIAARLVPMLVDANRAFEEILEPYSTAAAISDVSFQEWRSVSPGQSGGAYSVYGLREVAIPLQARCLEFRSSERYCCLRSSTHQGLPHLLGDYLVQLSLLRSAS
jgi:hypothetical protein